MCKWQILRQSLEQSVDLRRTLCGGQCFRWSATPRETFVGVIQHRAYELRIVQHTCNVENARKRSTTHINAVEFRRLNVSNSISTSRLNSSGKSQNIGSSCLIDTNDKWEADDNQDDDESFLTHYLSLDVNVPELWEEWTEDNSHKSHPLVQYLTSSKKNRSTDIDLYEQTELQRSKRKQVKEKEETQTEQSCVTRVKTKSKTFSRKRSRPRSTTDDAQSKYVSIRHLRQDLHETLLSFVCSQNNNVKRITQMIEQLTKLYGSYLCSLHTQTGEVQFSLEENNSSKPEANEWKKLTQSLHLRRDSNTCCTSIKCGKVESSKTNNTNAVADARNWHKKENVNSTTCSDEESKSEYWIHLYAFPTVDQLAAVSETQLRTAGFGYRSKYIVSCMHDILAARNKHEHNSEKCCSKENIKSSLRSLESENTKITSTTADEANENAREWNSYELPTLTARQHGMALKEPFYQAILCSDMTVQARRERLMALQGVGRKVADCVLLFACGHSEITPIDTHMAQIADLYLCNAAILSNNNKSKVGDSKSSLQLTSKANKQNMKKMNKGKLTEQLKEESRHKTVEKCKSNCDDWEEVLHQWRLKTECLRSKNVKSRNNTKNESNSDTERKKRNNKTSKKSDDEDNNALVLAPLNDKVHDAIQTGFKTLFGDYCGLAHSVLFYNRFRK